MQNMCVCILKPPLWFIPLQCPIYRFSLLLQTPCWKVTVHQHFRTAFSHTLAVTQWLNLVTWHGMWFLCCQWYDKQSALSSGEKYSRGGSLRHKKDMCWWQSCSVLCNSREQFNIVDSPNLCRFVMVKSQWPTGPQTPESDQRKFIIWAWITHSTGHAWTNT